MPKMQRDDHDRGNDSPCQKAYCPCLKFRLNDFRGIWIKKYQVKASFIITIATVITTAAIRDINPINLLSLILNLCFILVKLPSYKIGQNEI